MQQTTYFFVSLSKLNRNCISFKDGDETRGEDRIERKFRGELIKVGCHWREGKWRGDVCAARERSGLRDVRGRVRFGAS